MKATCSEIENISGNIIQIRVEDATYEEIAEVHSGHGISLAKVIKIDRDLVSLQVFTGGKGVSKKDKVIFKKTPMMITSSEDIIGRIFSGNGNPVDGGPELTLEIVEIGGPSVNPVKRIIPKKMIETRIPMIDIFNTLVKSQKIPIFSIPGEPYNELIARLAIQTSADIIIIGTMGIKFTEFEKMKNTLEKAGMLGRCVVFKHEASDPIIEALNVPDMALAVGEKFAINGKNVLVLLTDMTFFADAMKEVAITMEQVPSNRGYPGDLYSQLASRYEKAVDLEGAGSITILAVTTMPGDDVTHPVPDNTGYITEGQFYLKNGRIEPFGSLSRLKQMVNGKTRKDHRPIMDAMLRLYKEVQETREKQSMGFNMSPWDKKLLAFGKEFEEKLMNLQVNIPLMEGLNLCWKILKKSF